MKSNTVKSVQTILAILFCLAFLTSANVVFAQSSNANPRVFAKGFPKQAKDLPNSSFKTKLQSLPPQSRAKAMKILQTLVFSELDLEYMRVDQFGGVYYADYFPAPEVESAPDGSVGSDSLTALASLTQAETFLLHSRPGAPNVVFLDFDGQVISGTAWNSGPGMEDPLYAPAFDQGLNDTQIVACSRPGTEPVWQVNYSTAELDQIHEIWHRIAEDYAPWNIDVTTEEPEAFGPTIGRVLFTQDSDYCGDAMPAQGAGGVAYVVVFGDANYHTWTSPALVYQGGTTYASEAGSHEFGHNLGLAHDGTTTNSYYAGHGSADTSPVDLNSWAPIMGAGYYRNITQFSKNDYPDSVLGGTYQVDADDLTVITGELAYRTDDHVDAIGAGATALSVLGTGVIAVSNPEDDPHDFLPQNKGVIEDRTDVDVFYFDTEPGVIDITVEPAWAAFFRATTRRGANLDIQATLYDSVGTIIDVNDPLDDTDAFLSTTVTTAQRYYVAVEGVGNPGNTNDPANENFGYDDYASVGMYFISGNIFVSDNDPPSPDPMTWAAMPTALNSNSITMTATTATDLTPVEYYFECTAGGAGCADSNWQSSPTFVATGLAASTSYTYVVRARDFYSNTTGDSSAESATTDQPRPTPSFSFDCILLLCSFSDLSTDSNGTVVSWAWDFNDTTSTTVKSPVHGFVTSGTYQVSLTVEDNDGASNTISQSVIVTMSTPPTNLDVQISAGLDDVEEFLNDDQGLLGYVWSNSVDLDLIYDDWSTYGDMLVGLRFNSLDIPQGATITNAYIRFTSNGSNTGTPSLVFRAEDVDQALAFSGDNYNLTIRPLTTTSVTWNSLPSWSSGLTYESPDLSTVVQEVVSRPGWTANNSMVFAISGTSGDARRAHSWDGNSAASPVLHIDYGVAAPPCTANRSILANVWESISLPCDPGTANKLQDVFSNLVSAGKVYDVDWFIWRYDAATNTYYKMAPGDVMYPGQGYWIYTLTATTMDYTGVVNQTGDLPMTANATNGQFNYLGHTLNSKKPWVDFKAAYSSTVAAIPDADAWTVANPAETECAQSPPTDQCLVSRTAYVWKDGNFQTFDAHVPGLNDDVESSYGVFVRAYRPGAMLRIEDTALAGGASAQASPVMTASASSTKSALQIQQTKASGTGVGVEEKKDKDESWYIRLLASSENFQDNQP